MNRKAINILNNLLEEFKQLIKESDWMDDESKKSALEKVQYMDSKIGYSEQLYNDTVLDDEYEGVSRTATCFFLFYLDIFLLRQNNSFRLHSFTSPELLCSRINSSHSSWSRAGL